MFRRLELLIPPPIIALVAIAWLWWSPRLLQLPVWPLSEKYLVAIVFFIVGSFCAAWALYYFLKARTTISPHSPQNTHTLVTRGIYRVTRNPMYLGLFSYILAAGALRPSWSGLLGPVFFVLYLNRFQIKPEEKLLHHRFGQIYQDYCRTVRRWL